MSFLDEGWESAEKYKDEIPDGWYDGEPAKDPVDNTAVGDCPICGTHVVEKEKAFFCDNRECHFALWKDNRFFQAIGKEMTRDVAEELLNCGTVKLDGCVSKRTGNKFNCFVDLSVDEEQRPHFEIRFPERKRGGE